MSTSFHAFVEFRKPCRQAKKFLLSDDHHLPQLDVGEELRRIQDAQAFDFLLLVQQLHDVDFTVFLQQDCPCFIGHISGQSVGGIKVLCDRISTVFVFFYFLR